MNEKINKFVLFFSFFFFAVVGFSVLFIWFDLRSLGLAKIKTPPGHHRKRLAVESSRHHSRPDDSHMFIIKLPPNPYYYANTKTAQNKNGIEDKNQKVRNRSPKYASWKYRRSSRMFDKLNIDLTVFETISKERMSSSGIFRICMIKRFRASNIQQNSNIE